MNTFDPSPVLDCPLCQGNGYTIFQRGELAQARLCSVFQYVAVVKGMELFLLNKEVYKDQHDVVVKNCCDRIQVLIWPTSQPFMVIPRLLPFDIWMEHPAEQ